MAISWLPEGTASRPGDNEQRSLWKIVDLAASGGGGGGGATAPAFGVGSPEGVVTGDPGKIYSTALGGQWTKISGVGSTGWVNNVVE